MKHYVKHEDAKAEVMNNGITKRILSYDDSLMVEELIFEAGAQSKMHTHTPVQIPYIDDDMSPVATMGLFQCAPYGENRKERFVMCNTLVSGGFGNGPHTYRRGTEIGERMPAGLPKSFGEKMKVWKEKAHAEEWPGYYVKLARISFEYGGNRYELLPKSLGVDDEVFAVQIIMR